MANDLNGAEWRKSRRSGEGQNCVEVATNLPDVVGIRDSKDPGGPELAVSPEAFAAFVEMVKTEF